MQYALTPYSQPTEPFAWWEGAFDEQELNWLQEKAKNANINAQIGGDGNGATNKNIRRSQINWMHNAPDTEWVFERLSHIVSSLNAQFFQFDLTGFGEALQLTNYDQSEQGMYGWHLDSGGGGPSRKLSLVLQLTDPSQYEGGNLEIMTSMEPIKMKKQRGLVVVFPSYTLHQVTPVTQGNRQSLVAWLSGPRFK